MTESLTREHSIPHYNQRQDGDVDETQRLLFALGGTTAALVGRAPARIASVTDR